MNTKVRLVFPFWVSLLFLMAIASLCSAQSEDDGKKRFLTAHLPHFTSPQSVSAFISTGEGSRYSEVAGVFLEQAVGEEEDRLVWGGFLPAALGQPESLAIIVQDSEGKKHFFEFYEKEFSFYPKQNADEVRERIALLREENDQSRKEKEKLAQALQRLERDARFIGGFEEVEQIERERNREEQELKRIRSQVGQLRRSIEAIKRWKEPSDLTERKRVLIRDIQELQAKIGK